MNGLLGRILMQDIHHDGFKEITLSQFDYYVEEIDEGLLDQLVDKSPNLTKLTVSEMAS